MSGRDKAAKVVASKMASKGSGRKNGNAAVIAFGIVAAVAAVSVGLYLRWDAPELIQAYVDQRALH